MYILWKLKGNLCILDVQIVRIWWKFWIRWLCKIVKIQMKIEEHKKLSKRNGKLITLDVHIIQICFQIWSRQIYKIVKIQFKTMYKCTNHLELMKISKLLNIQNREILMENRNCWTYQIEKIQWKIVYIRCTNILDLLRNLISLKVRNRENSRENCVH